MPRIRRYIFNTLTVLSLLLLPATVGLWVDSHSYAITRWIGIEVGSDSCWVVESNNGKVAVLSVTFPGQVRRALNSSWSRSKGHFREPIDFHMFGFGGCNDSPVTMLGNQVGYWLVSGIAIPYWFLASIFAILPTICFIKLLRRQQRLAMLGKCPTCTYDLTGNQTGVCPECGAGINGKATHA